MILYRKRNYETKLRAFLGLWFLILTLSVMYFAYGVFFDFVNNDVGIITLFRACFSVYFLRHAIHSFFGIFRRQIILFPTSNEYELFYQIEDAENN